MPNETDATIVRSNTHSCRTLVEVKKMKLKILATVAVLSATSLPVPAKAENLQHVKQAISTRQCQQCDLSGAGLVMANLPGARFPGTNFAGANLSRANLSGADLRGANFSGASLHGANLAGANLTGATIDGADLRDAFLGNANFVGVNLNAAYIQGATGLPQTAGTPEDFYKWAVVEAADGNERGAIDHYNLALSLKPDFAAAYLGRGVARYRLGDEAGANIDAKKSSELFLAQGSPQGVQISQSFIKAMEEVRKPRKKGGSSNFLDFLGGIASLLVNVMF